MSCLALCVALVGNDVQPDSDSTPAPPCIPVTDEKSLQAELARLNTLLSELSVLTCVASFAECEK
jgi:hypothetical protein